MEDDAVLSELEKYRLDVQGYLLLKGVLSREEVDAYNRLLDEAKAKGTNRLGPLGIDPSFARFIDHPRVLPWIQHMLGPAPRLDVIYYVSYGAGPRTKDDLHGGRQNTSIDHWHHFMPAQNRNQYTLIVAAWALNTSPGEGGLFVVPGSHKAIYKHPFSRRPCDYWENPMGLHPPVEPGDVVLFTEDLTHGTGEWRGEGERRTVFLKWNRRDSSFHGPQNFHRPEILANCTPAQRRFLHPPSVWYRGTRSWTEYYEKAEAESDDPCEQHPHWD